MADQPVTVETQRDQLFQQGAQLRTRVIEALDRAYTIKVSLREALFRRAIVEAEGRSRELQRSVVEYEDQVSAFVQRLATAQQIQTPNGLQPISLNTQFQFAIYVSQVSTHRDAIRAAMRDLSDVVSSRRTQANTLTALVVSLASVFIALFLGVVNILSR